MTETEKINRAYEAILRQREANAHSNLVDNRGMGKVGTAFKADPTRASTLSDVVGDIKNNKGFVHNLEDTIKTTGSDITGLTPEVTNKLRFPSITDKLRNSSHFERAVNGEAGLLKNSKGFGKILPALGMGAAALAGLSIANKVQAGELGEAGLESADLATDYIPGVGEAKMALRPTEMGNAELPPEVMEERRKFNVLNRLK